MKLKSKKSTWFKALSSFSFSVLFILTLRWLFFEPFMIPSGSMESTLLINDFIFVNKFAFGLRLPFSSKWISSPRDPKRGDVVVFRSKDQADFILIKRVAAESGDIFRLHGDEIEIADHTKDNTARSFEQIDSPEAVEVLDNDTYYKVPEHFFIALGDNRANSSDSRSYGAVSNQNLIGKASFIWMSCEALVSDQTRFCDFTKMRWPRLFQRVK